MKKILIIGLPGAGKTTLARALNKRLKANLLNADKVRKKFNDWDFSKKGVLRQAKRMQSLAEKHNTVISATLFGALAGSSVLPFSRETFEHAITSTGKSVANNLAAFSAAFDLANDPKSDPAKADQAIKIETPTRASDPQVSALLERVNRDLAAPIQPTVLIGLRRLIDYQDPARPFPGYHI